MPPSTAKPKVPKARRAANPIKDPTIMVDGVPKISVNATKVQMEEFLKRHPHIGSSGEKVNGKHRRKPGEQLKLELVEGGHTVGAKAVSNPSGRGGASKPANIAAKAAEEQQISQIKLNGWTPEAFIPPPTPAVINMSGYGGIPIPPVSQAVKERKLEKTKIGDMRDYLSSRMANTAFKDLDKPQTLKLFLWAKQQEDNEISSISEGVPPPRLTLEPQEPEPQLQPDSDDDDLVEDTSELQLQSYEGVDYWENQDSGKLYSRDSEKSEYLVGEWNQDYDSIIFATSYYAQQHEEAVMSGNSTVVPLAAEPVTLPPAAAEAVLSVDNYYDFGSVAARDQLTNDQMKTMVPDDFKAIFIEYNWDYEGLRGKRAWKQAYQDNIEKEGDGDGGGWGDTAVIVQKEKDRLSKSREGWLKIYNRPGKVTSIMREAARELGLPIPTRATEPKEPVDSEDEEVDSPFQQKITIEGVEYYLGGPTGLVWGDQEGTMLIGSLDDDGNIVFVHDDARKYHEYHRP